MQLHSTDEKSSNNVPQVSCTDREGCKGFVPDHLLPHPLLDWLCDTHCLTHLHNKPVQADEPALRGNPGERQRDVAEDTELAEGRSSDPSLACPAPASSSPVASHAGAQAHPSLGSCVLWASCNFPQGYQALFLRLLSSPNRSCGSQPILDCLLESGVRV